MLAKLMTANGWRVRSEAQKASDCGIASQSRSRRRSRSRADYCDGEGEMKGNILYYGDNLPVLREIVTDESVDLVYLDPPFNSQATYNVLFKAPTGEQSHAQIEAFEDTWHWGKSAEQAFDEVMSSGNTDVAELLRAMRSFLKENDMMAYLAMMAIRLIELHRVLKESGSLYLHCDPSASHYLKLLMDAVFAPVNFKNEIIWKRSGSHNSAQRFGPLHDVILYYAKSDQSKWYQQRQSYDEAYKTTKFGKIDPKTGEPFQDVALTGPGLRTGDSGQPWRGFDPGASGRHWQPASYLYTKYEQITGEKLNQFPLLQRLDELDRIGLIYWPKKSGQPRYKQFLSDAPGLPLQDVWTDISPINSQAQERLGYPTQKPEALLERIIGASTGEGDIVLDPFCGCGTATHAAQRLNRRWIGIDITHLAISLIEKRLNDAFPGITYEVHGTPKDLDGAHDLAGRDKYQFQWWAVSLVKAVPFGGKKKGADTGIDGLIYFKDFDKKGKATTEKIVVSVKGGESVGVSMIRDLAHVVDREKAKMGLFITLAEPTGPMRTEAVKEGYFEASNGKYLKLQIVTVGELLTGKKPDLPPLDTSVFGKAAEEPRKQHKFEL
jgi:DNA modification methylase